MSNDLSHYQSSPVVLRIRQVEARTGIKRSLVYRLAQEGKFPRQFKINGGHASGWLSTEVDAWIAKQAASRA